MSCIKRFNKMACKLCRGGPTFACRPGAFGVGKRTAWEEGFDNKRVSLPIKADAFVLDRYPHIRSHSLPLPGRPLHHPPT
jgi:hypothetical protein